MYSIQLGLAIKVGNNFDVVKFIESSRGTVTSVISSGLYGTHGNTANMNNTLNTNTEQIKAPLAKGDHDRIDELEDCDGCTMNCFLCQRIFTDIDELQQHLCIHYAEHPDLNTTTQYFNCNVCERSLRSETELQEHYKRYHEATLIRKKMEAGRHFQCKLCGKVYISSQFLLKHVEMTHCPRKVSSKRNTEKPAKMYAAIQCVKPKIKYPPRSPYFNPNLCVDPNGYI